MQEAFSQAATTVAFGALETACDASNAHGLLTSASGSHPKLLPHLLDE